MKFKEGERVYSTEFQKSGTVIEAYEEMNVYFVKIDGEDFNWVIAEEKLNKI